ncbi:MAG: hypothetical protein N2037_07355 [Acidimicrobiales bacterium]|nr:hypothetical protein [Acidimicrobiales bacterium]
MSSATWFLRAVGAVLVRPGLWWIALVMLVRLARPGWWRQPPFLPLPDRAYLRFRLQTMYGDPDHEPEPADLITYLKWCRAWPVVTR